MGGFLGGSHLLQMRGLKHFGLDWEHHRHKSHLLQMRGLKPIRWEGWGYLFVASFTDAWIETDNAIKMSGLEVVASFTDAWIETIMLRYHLQLQ